MRVTDSFLLLTWRKLPSSTESYTGSTNVVVKRKNPPTLTIAVSHYLSMADQAFTHTYVCFFSSIIKYKGCCSHDW
jgi:hypothetical protein